MNQKRSLLFIVFFFSAGFLAALSIVATINPYYMILKEIVGDRAQVSLLIGPGQNPHTYSAKFSDVKKLNDADLVFANGLEFESFLEDTFKELEAKGKELILLAQTVPIDLLEAEPESDHEVDNHHLINPHVWLDPTFLSEYIIPEIVAVLAERDEKSREYYKNRATALRDELRAFDSLAREYLNQFAGSVVIVAHPSFTYFFKNYGITLVPVLEGAGDEPTISKVKSLIDFVKTENVIGIFAEYQQSKNSIDILVKATRLGHGELDSLGISRSGIIDLFDWNFKEMKRVFGK